MPYIERAQGRRAFGGDPAGYEQFRPSYSERVYELLRERCQLGPGRRTFEIGPGTGKATRELLAQGASPLVVIEPDERLAAYLAETFRTPDGTTAIDIRQAPFEDVVLADASFDLGTAATAFHWLEAAPALQKVARLLRSGGWWAMWWHVFADPERPDPFLEATQHLLGDLGRSPSGGAPGKLPFALDAEARLGELTATGAFEDAACEMVRETVVLTGAQVRGLFATFSEVSAMPAERRDRLLDAVEAVVHDRFGGKIEKPTVTSVYTARRR